MRTCNIVVIAVVAFFAPFVVCAPARAGLVEVVVSGVVSDTDVWNSRVPDATGPVVGDPVEFRYTLDLDEPTPFTDDFRSYAMEEFTFSVGGDEFSLSGSPSDSVGIGNRSDDYWYKASTWPRSDSFLGFYGFSVRLVLIDSTAIVLGGLDHPESLDLADYDFIEFRAGCADCFTVGNVDPTVFWITPTAISVNVVPEPATAVLLMLSAPLLYRCRRHSVIQ